MYWIRDLTSTLRWVIHCIAACPRDGVPSALLFCVLPSSLRVLSNHMQSSVSVFMTSAGAGPDRVVLSKSI